MDKARSFPYDEGRKDGMPMEIGAKLRQARIAAGLTQEQTAEALGVSRQSISNWENEKNYPDIVSVVRLSDLYAVSLDALLKEEAPMSDYLDYLEESTNTVRSRREQSLLILLCVYLGIWAVSVLFFWLLTGPSDAMGYGIVFLWLVLPVAAFVISLLIGRGGYGGRTADVPERKTRLAAAAYIRHDAYARGVRNLHAGQHALRRHPASAAAESAAEGNDHLRRRFLVRSSDAETEEAARGERRIGEIGQKKSRPGGRLFERYV